LRNKFSRLHALDFSSKDLKPYHIQYESASI